TAFEKDRVLRVVERFPVFGLKGEMASNPFFIKSAECGGVFARKEWANLNLQWRRDGLFVSHRRCCITGHLEPLKNSVPTSVHAVQYLVQYDYDLGSMNGDVELRHLRYFVAVAEELHFGRAAERLHLSQPPLSQQIRKLEDILGYALFVRTSRSVKLTTSGQAYLERALRTLRNVQRDIEETRRIGQGEVGSLHIGFVGSAMLTTLPGIFRAYREAYPWCICIYTNRLRLE
ncbi:MAG TPA: LysR family transcriptional regulator, partial [Bryobacteraceae bacterium]|nr:LysR family transcriptional regulator [Bryobacteraceae bacterium]